MEIFNEMRIIEKLNNKISWFKWLFKGADYGLNEKDVSTAIKDITIKVNEIIDELNNLNNK